MWAPAPARPRRPAAPAHRARRRRGRATTPTSPRPSPHAGRDRPARPARHGRGVPGPPQPRLAGRTPSPAARRAGPRGRRPARTWATSTMRYAALLGPLARGLDGRPASTDADAWYCILEGTAEPSRRRGTGDGPHRTRRPRRDRQTGPPPILLAADDYSAVSRRVPLSNLYERGRSLGLGVQVIAPSPGKGSEPTTTSATASPPPQTAASASCAPPPPSPSYPLAGTGRVLESGRSSWAQAAPATKEPAASPTPGSSTRPHPPAQPPARPPTSATAAQPTSRSAPPPPPPAPHGNDLPRPRAVQARTSPRQRLSRPVPPRRKETP